MTRNKPAPSGNRPAPDATNVSPIVEPDALIGVVRDDFGCPVGLTENVSSPEPTAAQNRDRGVAVVEAASDEQGRAVVDQAIRVYADSGRPFSANDIRHLLPAERANLIGARFLAAAKSGRIKRVGYEPATHAAGHGRPVALWQATRARESS